MLHPSPQSRYLNLLRSYERLKKEVHSADFSNFVTDANHLREAIEKDPACTPLQKIEAQKLYTDRWCKMCNEIPNNEKHFKLRKKDVSDTVVKKGFDIGCFGVGGFGVGEHSIVLELADGTQMDALDFIESVINLYRPIFP